MADIEATKKPLGDGELDYAKEFWTQANIVTAFAIVQTLTFALKIGPHDSSDTLFDAVLCHQTPVLIGAGVATIVYLAFIGFCQLMHWKIVSAYRISPTLSLSFMVWNITRLVIVAIAGGFSILLVWGVDK